MRVAAACMGLMLAACNGGSDASQYGDQILEKGRIDIEDMDGTRRDLVGSLEVDGSGSSWTVTVDTTGGEVEIDVFSPGQSDLSALDGLDAMVTLVREPLSGEVGISITDTDGGLLYLFEPIGEGTLTADTLGAGFVQPATDLGTETINLVTLHLSSVQFDDDAGGVEANPGEPATLTLLGSDYRAVLIAAYSLELDADAPVPNCESATELLSYEVVLIGESADLEPLVRPDNGNIAVGGCDTL